MLFVLIKLQLERVMVMLFNTTFKNILTIS